MLMPQVNRKPRHGGLWRHLSGDAVGQVHRLDSGNFGDRPIRPLPTGVLASGFAEVLARRKEEQKMERMICPHCGRCVGEEHMQS